VDELDLMHMEGEKHFYERRPRRDHIHMACLRCGRITEFESVLFDRLKGQIQRDCGFHILVTRLEMGGYCTECRSASLERRPV
jgi:Fur family ferric uptake transcriptional regulator